MALRIRELGIASLVALICASAAGQTPKKTPAPVGTAKHRVKKQAAKPPEPAPTPVVQQQPPAPPPPSRPYEMSPVPPQITFNGGQLTIVAPNSSLADIP